MVTHTVESTQGFLRRGWARLSRRKQRATTAMTMASGSVDEAHEAVEPLPSSFIRHQQPTNSYQVDNHIDPSALPNRKNIANRTMDRLRRSFRKSFSRGGKSSRLTANQQNSMEMPITPGGGASTSGSTKGNFSQDAASVRAGTCHFQVKYLGSCEVFESRGMQVCENALRHLRERKRSTKAILYSLRVVDQEHSRGLILDQTVEKVSFCAPDRRNDKGFAYICRDGATRRWMCHGFQAAKDSGERLSHAVGCSFAICLEKKRKREAEIEVFNTARSLADEVNSDRNGPSRNNQAYSSFRRQLSLSERRQDPQKAIMVDPLPLQRPANEGNLVSFDDIGVTSPSNGTFFDRQQTSFNVNGGSDQSGALRRFHSLRTDIQNKISRGNVSTLYNEPIYEGDDEAWPGCENQFDNASFSARTPRDAQKPANDQNKENGPVLDGLNISGQGFTLKPLTSNGPVPQLSSLETNKQPNTATTTAEDWLESALQPKLTVSSSQIQPVPTTNGIYPQLNGLNLVSQPPPPLPPASILASPNKSTQGQQELDVPEQPARQSIKYQILEETDMPPHSPPRMASPLTSQIDLFGQPVFNPLQVKASNQQQEEPSAFVKLCSQTSPRQNGFSQQQHSPLKLDLDSKASPVKTENKEVDPFDVGWSTQVLQSSRQNTTPNTTPRSNPFKNESAPVNV